MKSGSGKSENSTIGGNGASSSSAKRAYLVVGVAAAAVSAATAAYILWSRSKTEVSEQAETVQQLLDQCHDQVRSIEQRLAELNSASAASA